MAVLTAGLLLLAAVTGTEEVDGAVNTLREAGYEVDATTYLINEGVLPAPRPVATVWDRLMQCEAGSSGQWRANTRNGYYGGLQMDMTFWRRHGGLVYASRPDLASREAQIAVAERGLAAQGWGAWPACSRRLGLRR